MAKNTTTPVPAPAPSFEYIATKELQDYDFDYIAIPEPTKAKRDYTPTEESVGLIAKYGNKSQAIRALNKEGYSRSQIANMLNIRYQHVRNVLGQELKKK
jgi:energy-converting hydrogenase Eha subunit F